MGNIGNKLCFHPLALNFFIYSTFKVRLNLPQLGLIAFKDTEIF